MYLALNKATLHHLQHPSISQTLVLKIQRILSVLPIAVSERGSLLASKIISKLGCQGRWWLDWGAVSLRQGLQVQPAGRGGQPDLSLLVDRVFSGRVGLKQLCLLCSSGFGWKSAREVAAFVPSVSLQYHLVLMSKCPPSHLGLCGQGTDPTPACHSDHRG